MSPRPDTAENPEDVWLVEPSRIGRRLLWHVYSAGGRRMRAPDRHEPFEKPGVHLFWVRTGQGNLSLPTGDFALRKGGTAWLLDLQQRRCYSPAGGHELSISGIRFGGPGLDAWLKELSIQDQPEFEIGDVAPLQEALSEVLRLTKRRPKNWEWQVHLVITGLLERLLAARQLLESPEEGPPNAVVRVLDAVAADPTRDWKANELAAIARISYSGLRTLFRRTQGRTLHAFLQEARLEHARVLLADSRLSIKEVADRLHFSSAYYFSHFFRRVSGVSPTEYRRVLQKTGGK